MIVPYILQSLKYIVKKPSLPGDPQPSDKLGAMYFVMISTAPRMYIAQAKVVPK